MVPYSARKLPTPMLKNTVVVVGDRFDPSMFNESDAFGLRADPGGRMLVGPIAQYTYGGGRYAFSIVPNRIDLSVAAPDVSPRIFVSAANGIAAAVDRLGNAVSVTGLGLNCEGAIAVGVSGRQFCQGLLDASSIERLMDGAAPTSIQLQEQQGAVRYNVRFEPEAATDGQNLFVAVNAHQDIEPGGVSAAVERLADVKSWVETLHGRLG